MPRFIATVHVVLDADDQAHACEKLGTSLNGLTMSERLGGPFPIHTWAYVNYPGYRYAMDGSAYMGPIELSADAPADLRQQNLTPLAPADPIREEVEDGIGNLDRLLDAYVNGGRRNVDWFNVTTPAP